MGATIRIGDEVQILASAHHRKRREEAKGPTRGKVIAVDRASGTVTVEGCNIRTKHLKRSQRHPQGGVLRREAPVPASRVMLVAEDGKPVRLSRAERSGDRIVRKAAKAGNGS
ncbi:MAG: 50S ribosomal protein L24 [Planctomycetes bacterium]|nr:50S ribosomal protein L24 [Planctomycetota bacterium]